LTFCTIDSISNKTLWFALLYSINSFVLFFRFENYRPRKSRQEFTITLYLHVSAVYGHIEVYILNRLFHCTRMNIEYMTTLIIEVWKFCPQYWELNTRLTNLLCKKIIVSESIEVKMGLKNPAESYNEGCGSKRAVLPMLMVMKILYQCYTLLI
jgi:hypothetical protein